MQGAAKACLEPKEHDAAWCSNWRKARETAIRQKSAKNEGQNLTSARFPIP